MQIDIHSNGEKRHEALEKQFFCDIFIFRVGFAFICHRNRRNYLTLIFNICGLDMRRLRNNSSVISLFSELALHSSVIGIDPIQIFRDFSIRIYVFY
ncbi:hypothetical protein GJ496_003052 [Pomphorhynchus laevis]|nr:hypothetical protein GJ496_003052 [Pomphorhynchus laevis]